jgi:hypothetical protein
MKVANAAGLIRDFDSLDQGGHGIYHSRLFQI